jgi:alpha-1,3-rhamnosyl/mannosyltransferase
MRVILNGVSALKPKTGVGHTTANLHRALADLGTGDSFWLYPGAMASRVATRLLKRKQNRAATRSDGKPAAWRGRLVELAKAAYREHFRAAARWGRFDLYHEPNFVPFRAHLPTVVTVHDLSVVLHPEWHPADRVKFHERHFRRGVETAERVVVVSEAVRREMIAHLGFPTESVVAVHNGIGDQFRPQSSGAIESVRNHLGLPPRYLLAVGTIEPRKNVATLLRAFCDLPAELRAECPLVLAGGWGWKSEPERELFESEARHRGVIHLGYVDDADLPALYGGAAVLLYPSFYEGFGLPPVEMLACGGAVIASTADAVREVVGRHALLLDPHDLAGWRDAMRRVIEQPDCLDEYRRGGSEHARQFTWERAARKTLSVYRQVLGLADAAPTGDVRKAA